jgi:hypothetical protein
MNEPNGKDVVLALRNRGINSNWEYPGWLSIIQEDGYWAFGTVNGTWQGDFLVKTPGSQMFDHCAKIVDTGCSPEDDPKEVAKKIEEAILA